MRIENWGLYIAQKNVIKIDPDEARGTKKEWQQQQAQGKNRKQHHCHGHITVPQKQDDWCKNDGSEDIANNHCTSEIALLTFINKMTMGTGDLHFK